MENKSVDLSQKKGRLVVRLMSIAMVAIVIVAVLLTIIGAMSYSRMSMTMVEEELKVATKLIADEFEHEWDGDWALDAEGNLTKGGQNIYEEYTSQMDDLSEGLGLGLPLSKRHALSLGGDLIYDRDYKDGCRFIVEMPK